MVGSEELGGLNPPNPPINSNTAQMDIVGSLLSDAEESLLSANFAASVSLYSCLLDSVPQIKPLIRGNLTLALKEWGESLTDEDDVSELLKHYQHAISNYGDCEQLLNNVGGHLFRMGMLGQAMDFFQRALTLNPEYLKARENLDNICSHLVERWHFRMLNDVKRNALYDLAIQSAIQQVLPDSKLSVLDIGTGTGLLSMYAAHAIKARNFPPNCETFVCGCEMATEMFDIAKEVIAVNGFSGEITFLNKMSTDITVPHDIPARANVLMTEIFDSGLLGEHILPTLDHAWDNLIDSKCLVIPQTATVFVTAVECDVIRKQNRFIYPCLNKLDLNGLQIICTTGNQDLYTGDIGNDDSSWEPYTSEKLMKLRKGFRFLSNPAEIQTFKFFSAEEIKSYLVGITKHLSLPVMCAGRLDALVVWFDLDLDGKQHKLTTSPVGENGESGCRAVCWEQAVYPVLPNHLVHESSLDVNIDDKIEIECCIGDGIKMKCRKIVSKCQPSFVKDVQGDPGTNQTIVESDQGKVLSSVQCDLQKDSTNVKGDQEKDPTNVKSDQDLSNVFFCDRPTLSVLNDIDYNQCCVNVLQKIKASFLEQNKPFRLLVLGSELNFLPLQALNLGADVTVLEQNSNNRKLFEKLVQINGMEATRLKFDSRNISELNGESWSALFVDVIDPLGCIRQNFLEDIALARMVCLEKDAVIMPARLAVHGMLINSLTLLNDSRVISDDSTKPFRVSESINKYQMYSHYDIELSTLDHTAMTTPFLLFTFDLKNLNTEDDISDAALHASNFLRKECTIEAAALETSSVTAMIYWFDIALDDNVVVSTINLNCHWKQAAVILTDGVPVESNDKLIVKAVCDGGYFGVKVEVVET